MTDTEVRTGPAPRPAWQQCPSCGDLVDGPRLARNLQACPGCGYHHRLTGQERIGQLFDPGCFEPLPGTGAPADLLGFTDTMSYPDRLAGAQEATGLAEAVLSGHGRISGRPAVAAVMDFRFMGGSLGAAAGELITRAAEEALRRRWPLLLVTASGGARMQEGILSLMQMAKTSQAIARLREAGVLSVSLLTDPTSAGSPRRSPPTPTS
jgi:acetyl-CoA carboxylase carboxyl transferase beta subunit